MWAEDFPQAGFQHAPEFLYAMFVLVLGALLMWLLPTEGLIINSALASMLIAAPCLVLYHRGEEWGERERPLLGYALYALPAIALGVAFLVGLGNPALETVFINGDAMYGLRDGIGDGPTTTLPGRTWLIFASSLALYLLALVTLFVIDNEWTLASCLTWLSYAAMGMAAVGWGQYALQLAGDPLGAVWFLRFFATEGYASIACLWFCVATVMIAFRLEREGWWLFLRSGGVLRLSGWLLLGSSAVQTGEAIHGLTVAGFAVGLPLGLAAARLLTRPRRPSAAGWYAVLGIAGGLAAVAVGATDQAEPQAAPELAMVKAQLWERLLAERPWTGWGGGSLDALLVLERPIELPLHEVGAPPSSFDRLRLEQGYAGALVWGLAVAVPLFGFARLKHRANYSYGLLLVGAAQLPLLAQTPAGNHLGYAFGVWLVFFSAVRWSQIIDLRARQRKARAPATMVFGVKGPSVPQAKPTSSSA